MTCSTCITALAGTDGFNVDSPNKTNALAAAIGGAVGYLVAGKYRWWGLAAGAAAGYLLAPMVSGLTTKETATAAAQKTMPPPPQVVPPGGRPPVQSTQTVRIMPATPLQPPPEIAQQSETDAFLQEWMSAPQGPMQF